MKIPLPVSDFDFGEFEITFRCPHCNKRQAYPIKGYCKDNQANNFKPMETTATSHSATLYPDCEECGEEIEVLITANFFVKIDLMIKNNLNVALEVATK